MSKQKKGGGTDQSIGVPVRGREAWVAITVDQVPPIRHKTSSSLWILLIIIHCNVYYAPAAPTLEYAKVATCKHLLSIPKAANLSRLLHLISYSFDAFVVKHVVHL